MHAQLPFAFWEYAPGPYGTLPPIDRQNPDDHTPAPGTWAEWTALAPERMNPPRLVPPSTLPVQGIFVGVGVLHSWGLWTPASLAPKLQVHRCATRPESPAIMEIEEEVVSIRCVMVVASAHIRVLGVRHWRAGSSCAPARSLRKSLCVAELGVQARRGRAPRTRLNPLATFLTHSFLLGRRLPEDELNVREVRISCPDATGLGVDLSRVLLDFGLRILRGDISTDGKWCFLIFRVQLSSGEALREGVYCDGDGAGEKGLPFLAVLLPR